MAKSYKEIMNDITTFIFDVDGVLTDGSVFVSTEGEMLRTMNIRDGYALKSAVDCGYNVCIISGGSNEGVRVRLRNLGITDIHLGTPDKVATFDEYTDIYNIKPEQVLYMGDDIPDIPVLKSAGLSACPQDAVSDVKQMVAYQSPFEGGKNCVRDIIEQTLRVQGKWMSDQAFEW